MKIYHGSDRSVPKPLALYEYANAKTDFGIGFYTTQDDRMAKKWACGKVPPFLNTYEVDLSCLRVKKLKPDKEWLNLVVANRTADMAMLPFNPDDYDVIIGPTADDRMFTILELYLDGFVSAENAIKIMNCLHLSDQIVFKTQQGIDDVVRFVGAREITGQEKAMYTQHAEADRVEGARRTREMLAQINRGR